MASRTFAIGDVHGDLEALQKLLRRLPKLDAGDTLVFLGDYCDRGPASAATIRFLRDILPNTTMAKVVCLRGNHEDGWLRVASGGWPEFVIPHGNGCLATLRSYTGKEINDDDLPEKAELESMLKASFFPREILEWMNALPYWYEDEHAIYVHAGLVQSEDGNWVHPKDTENKALLLWVRTMEFFAGYKGKRVVCGHTTTECLPPDLSSFTPDDPTDMWVHGDVCVIDTGCGKGGYLTALELPAVKVFESRDVPAR